MKFKLNNGYEIPAIGYGTWQAVDEELEKGLEKALEIGYRHIDTAAIYFNEHIIGKVLKNWISSGKVKREDLYIVTKLPFHAVRGSSVEKMIKKSLKNLQLDYLDMYLVHGPFSFIDGDEFLPKDENGKIIMDLDTDHVTLWKAMEDQVDAGRTRSIGLSNFNEKQIDKILSVARIPPANLQIELHLYLQQKSLVNWCKSANILITSYSSLGTAATMKKFGKNVSSFLENDDIIKISEKYKKTPAQVALRFLVQNNIVVIPKSVNENRIKENFQITDFELSDNDMKIIANLDKGEEGRLLLFEEHFPGIKNHPEYPFSV